jgi:hypothetical protein
MFEVKRKDAKERRRKEKKFVEKSSRLYTFAPLR